MIECHGITTLDNVAMAGTGAWHGLGVTVPENMEVDQAVREYLGWAVEKQPLYIQVTHADGTKGYKAIENHRAMVRMDHQNVLGVVGENYEPIQHESMIEDIKALCGESGAKVHTIGSLRGGQKIWILLELQDECTIAGDRLKQYLAVMSSHDGSMAYTMAPTAIRIVCNNTLTAAINSSGKASEGKSIRVKHTKNAQGAIEQARKVMGSAKASFESFAALTNHLAGVRVNDRFADFIANQLFKGDTGQAETARTKLIEAYKNPRGGDTKAVSGTAFGVFNAVTEYVDYLANVRKTSGRDEGQARAESSLLGAGAKKRVDALSIIKSVVDDKAAMDMILASNNSSETPTLDALLA